MVQILACIDQSSYANSVCDHAGWFASDPNVGVEVFHVVENCDLGGTEPLAPSGPTSAANALIERATHRLREEGVGPITSGVAHGTFVERAVGRDAEIIVLGKRGSHAQDRERLGSSVAPIIRATAVPVCLTSQLYLPIKRGLVLLDANMAHHMAVEFIHSQPRLDDLPMDVVVIARPGDDPGPKLDWARDRLQARQIDVFSVRSRGIDQAVARYSASRAADMIIVSRAVIASDPALSLQSLDGQGLWGGRTSILVC